MIRRRGGLHIPILAMVDAFVGGIAIILVLTLLSAPTASLQGTVPIPDLIVACGPERDRFDIQTRDESGTPFRVADIEGLAQALAERAPPGSLHVNILVRPADGEILCARQVQNILRAANRALDADTLGFQAPVFLVDIAYGAPDED